jgi:hypothetical protein
MGLLEKILNKKLQKNMTYTKENFRSLLKKAENILTQPEENKKKILKNFQQQ